MAAKSLQTIEELLISSLPRELVLSVEEGLGVGANLAFQAASGMRDGHLSNVVGQMRHFHMNETFADALESVGATPSPVRGNALVVGRAGVFQIARFNVNQGPWYNAKRSSLRRKLAEANRSIEPLVQPNLFETVEPTTILATVFFVAVFSGSITLHPEFPVDVQIAVPDSRMHNWLYCESIGKFVQEYDSVIVQEDKANPALKTNARKKQFNEGELS